MENIYLPETVAKLLQLDIRTIYTYIKKGKLKAVKFGRVYRITESQLTEFINNTSANFSNNSLEDALKKIVDQLKSKYDPEKIILFGSLASGKKDAKDIDLLIIKKTNKNYFDRLIEVVTLCEYDVPVDFLIYTPEEIEDEIKNNLFLRKEIIEKGKILYDKAE